MKSLMCFNCARPVPEKDEDCPTCAGTYAATRPSVGEAETDVVIGLSTLWIDRRRRTFPVNRDASGEMLAPGYRHMRGDCGSRCRYCKAHSDAQEARSA